MKIGALTFHSSYNFGSNLQTYALQQYVCKLAKEQKKDTQYEVINLRTDSQKNIYDHRREKNIVKKIIKKVTIGKKLNRRQARFEEFINNYLNITKEYQTRKDIINDAEQYDVCITGSDQIWNLAAYDFDWSYFLEGINCKKKVSYAVSSGPKKREIPKEDEKRIERLLKDYNSISVREEGTKEFIGQFTDKDIQINMDPTILLDKVEWNEIIDENKILEEPYILYYSLRPSKSRIKFLKELSKKMNMKIVTVYPAFKYEIFSGFVKKYESGPLEFLNLLKNAKLVISSSFHGTIFSVILNVPFYALNGKNDYRISTLLKVMKLEDRMIMEDDNIEEIAKNANKVEFNTANEMIGKEREKSKNYLVKALGLEE